MIVFLFFFPKYNHELVKIESSRHLFQVNVSTYHLFSNFEQANLHDNKISLQK